MKRLHVVTCVVSLLFTATAVPVFAGGGNRLFLGLDLGVSEPVNRNYDKHVETGATGNPYLGYMFNDYLGLQAQTHFTFHPSKDENRGFKDEDDVTGLFGATAGPRLAYPFGDDLELYVTGQGGVFTDLSGRIEETAPGYSVGGGVDIYVTHNVALSLFGRYNRAYTSPRPTRLGPPDTGPPSVPSNAQGPSDARWMTVGVGVKYDFREPPPPPPAPRVAQAPPPPPPPPPVKRKITLRGVNFDFDKASLRKDGVVILDEAVSTLKDEPNISVVVEGHTDSLGTEKYNMKLSRQRAQAVHDYLVSHGIASRRLKVGAAGESQPIAPNDTDSGRAQNRRVELRVQ